MVAKLRLLVLGLVAVAALGAVTAGAASAKAPKPELILSEKKVVVPDNTPVKGGWAVAIETSETPLVYYGCEVEGSMKLITNESTKADVATGSVGVPSEECEAEEIKEEGGGGVALLKRTHHSRRRARARHRARSLGVTPDVVPTLEDPTFTGGVLESEEMTVKKAGTLGLSKALEVSGTEEGKKCSYASKTKLKGTWPSVEYPDTANIESEFVFKLVKGSAKGCVKEEEGYVEAWLGPDFEELEAELT